MIAALREALAQYRAAMLATTPEDASGPADRAQAYAFVAAIQAVAHIVAVILTLIALRCSGEAVGAFVASDVPELSAWLRSGALRDGWSLIGYALAWLGAGAVVAHGGRVTSRTLWIGMGNDAPAPSKWRWPWTK